MIWIKIVLKISFLLTLILILDLSKVDGQVNDSLNIKSLITQAMTSYQQKDYEKTREFALKVLEIDTNYGEAYILIGIAYASSADMCSDNLFSKGMVYCVAVDMFEKAKEVDASVSEKAVELINVYSRYFPSRDGVPFGAPYERQYFKINCWINRETIVRFSDYQHE